MFFPPGFVSAWRNHPRGNEQFIDRIQKAIVRVLQAEHAERTAKAIEENKAAIALHGKDAGKITIPAVYPFQASELEPGAVRLRILKPVHSEIKTAEADIVYKLYAFYRSSSWVAVQGAENGTSWIELYMLRTTAQAAAQCSKKSSKAHISRLVSFCRVTKNSEE